MKNFDEEYKMLIQWYFSEREKIEKSSEPWNGGLDGKNTEDVQKLGIEYRKKLKAIKRKYGK